MNELWSQLPKNSKTIYDHNKQTRKRDTSSKYQYTGRLRREIFRIRQSVDIPVFSSTEENSYTAPLYTIGKHLFLLSKNILYRKPTYDM